jgi:hypothetical protein
VPTFTNVEIHDRFWAPRRDEPAGQRPPSLENLEKSGNLGTWSRRPPRDQGFQVRSSWIRMSKAALEAASYSSP